MFLRFLFSQSQFDHLRYNSLTLALSQKTAPKSTRSYSFIAHSLATQEFPVIVDFIYWFSLHSCQNGHVLFVTQYDNNTFPTHSPHMVRYRSICDNLCFNHTIWILSYLNHMNGNKTIISPWSMSLYFLFQIEVRSSGCLLILWKQIMICSTANGSVFTNWFSVLISHCSTPATCMISCS